MKKLFFVSAFSLFCASAFAQDAITSALLDQTRKDKEKSDKSIQDPKSNAKAATWMERAKTYEAIALQFTQLDSNAAITAYDAYKKVVELDVTKKGDAGRSAKDAQKVLNAEEGTNLYNAFVKQGAEKYQNKNMDGALKMFQMAQVVNPKDTLSALYGGIAAQQLDNKKAAIEQFEKYATNGGTDPSVYYGLAQMYRSENNPDQAIATLKRGIERSGDSKDLRSEIVNIYLATGKEDMAINELKGLIEKDPGNVQNQVNLAILYDNSNIKLLSQIRELKEKVAAASGGNAAMKRDLENEKGKLEAFEGEVKRLNARIKAQPKNPDLKRQLDQATQGRNEAREGVAKLETSMKEAADAAAKVDKSKLQSDLDALVSKQQSARELAIGTYQAALKADPKNYDALFNLGVFYFNDAVEMKKEVDNMSMQEYQQRGKEVEGRVCGRFQKAKPYFEQAVQANDSDEAKETLETVNNILAQFEGKNVKCVAVE
jgi:hypothetical protein